MSFKLILLSYKICRKNLSFCLTIHCWVRAIFFVPCDCHELFAERCCRFHAEVFFGAIGLNRVAEETKGVTTALSQVQKLAQ